MEKPFFSLITPVYNIERLLSVTIESALKQTFSDWEMILVDDGSPDNAGAICDEYAEKDPRIQVIHKQNEGLAEARNVGIRACQGQYFLILEGSDLFPNDRVLETVHQTLVQFPCDIYFGKLRDVMEGSGEVLGEQKDYCVNGSTKGGKDLFVTLYEHDDVLALSSPVNKFFRTAFVKGNELWFYKGIYHDDDEWLPRTIALSETAYFTNEIIYDALTWDGCFGKAASDKSLTKKAVDKMFIANRCIKDINSRFPNDDQSFLHKYTEYYVRMYLDGICALNYVKDPSCLKSIRKSIQDNADVFTQMKNCESKNLHYLRILQKIFGTRITCAFILQRYGL